MVNGADHFHNGFSLMNHLDVSIDVDDGTFALLDKAEIVHVIVQRGAGTVSTVKNTATYEDYKDRLIKQAEAPKKQVELPLDKPKTNTLDIKKQDIMVKFSALFDAIITYEPAAINARPYSKRCINAAMTRLEEARLWLKETF